MTPEFIKACQQAKEEGWLKWEPKWGDWGWYSYHALDYHIEQLALVETVEVKTGYTNIKMHLQDGHEDVWSDYNHWKEDFTWLPTEGQLMKILQEACMRASCIWEPGNYTERQGNPKAGKWWVSAFVDREQNYDIHVGDVDLPLALLKAVAVVRRK